MERNESVRAIEILKKEESAKGIQKEDSTKSVKKEDSIRDVVRKDSVRNIIRKDSVRNIRKEDSKKLQDEAPKTSDKQWLTIFSEVLGVDISQLTPETELQSLGIASLLAMQLISRLQDELDLEVQFADLVDKKTIGDLDAYIQVQVSNPTRKKTRITPAKRVRPPPAIMRILPEGNTCRMVPASYAQERIWLDDQRRPELCMYNIWAGLRIQGDFDPVQFRWALSAMIERHESLRTTFHLNKGHLMQVIHKNMPLIFELTDLSVHEGKDTKDTVLGFARKNTARKFDLTKGPLMATLAVILPNDECLIHLSMHHIIGDAWTLNVIFMEVMRIYAGEILPKPTLQYADYSVWHKEQINSAQSEAKLDYWVRLLEGDWPTIEFPIPHTKAASPPMRPCHFLKVPISDDLVDQIERTCVTLNCSRFALFLAMYQALLHRHTSLDDIIIGTPTSNRNNFQVEAMVGVFINTLPMRSRITAQTTLREMIEAAQQSAADTNDHQDVPLQKILAAISNASRQKDATTFQALFVHHDVGFFRSRSRSTIPKVKTRLLMMEDGWEMLQPAAMFDLQILVQEDRGTVSLRLEYNADALERDTVSRMASHYLTLLKCATSPEGVDDNVWRLELLSPQERTKLLVEWNKTYQDLPSSGKCAHQLISDQATRTPNSIALVYPLEGGGKQAPSDPQELVYRQSAGKMTYGELEQLSNFLAQHLMSMGVAPDDLVGLGVEQSSWVMVVGMIAIWKAGGAYVALNPKLPADRLKYMVDKASARVVLTLTHLVPAISAALDKRVRVVDVDGQWKKIQGSHRPVRPRTTVAQHNLAYVLFTSGSTGLPKGVMIEHKALCNRLVTYANDHITPADRVAQVSAYSFDASLPELFSTLIAGASLYLVPVGVISGPELAAFYRDNNITNGGILTPSRMATLKGESFKCVKRIVAIGEQLTTNIVKMLAADSRVFNTYGPTEITVSSSEIECFAKDPLVTIGKTLPNYLSYVLDKHMQPVPIGVAGELYIGGAGLARGYIGDPSQTQSKFVPNPFLSLLPLNDKQRAVYGDRIYKTGDLVRYLPNSEMEYIGRTDFQVKLRGLRIELGEIETVISQCEGVRQVVVMVVDGAQDSKMLVAYVVPEVDETTVRTHIGTKLPAYMVPQVFMMMSAFPMNTSGKVERKLLPAPQAQASSRLEPRNNNERILLEVWSKVLNIKPDQIGGEDMFFSLGGDSITAVTLVYHAKMRGILLTTQQVLTHQTIRAQAEVCELVTPTSTIEGQIPWGTSSMAPIHHWMFASPLAVSGGRPLPSFNQYALLQFQQPADLKLVSRAIAHLLINHPSLRATFDRATWTMSITEPTGEEQERLIQRGKHNDQSALCEVHTLTTSEPLSQDFADNWDARLNPAKGICMRGVLVVSEFAPESYPKLLLVAHQLCVDKVSWEVILSDFQTAFYQLQSNTKVDLIRTSPYRLWTDSLHSMAEEDTDWSERQSAFWRRALTLSNPLSSTLCDAPAKAPAVPTSVYVRLSAPQTEMLLDDALHIPFHTTVPDVLLTALLLAFTRWTGTPLLRVDLLAEGREKLFEDVDLSRTVGCCVCKYPVVLQLTQNASSSERFLRDALLNVKEAIHQVPNQGMGYGMLRYMSKTQDALVPEDTHDSEVCFRYAGKPSATQDTRLFSLVQGGNGIPQDTAKAIASLIDIDALIGVDGKLQLVFTFRKSRFQEATITRLSAWYIEELELLLNHMAQQRNSRFPTPSDFSLARLTQAELAYVFTQGRPVESVMDVYVASQLQQGMLFHAIGDKRTGTYTNQLVFDIKGTIAIENLKRAFVATVQHFPVLRTEYVWEGLAECHSIVKTSAEPEFIHYDWRSSSKSELATKLQQFLENDRVRGFDLTKAPLMRIAILTLEDKVHRAVVSNHHIITDGWSHTTILAKIFTLYQLATKGELPANLQASTEDGFKQFVDWSLTRSRPRAQEFWRGILAGVSEPTSIPIIGKSKTEGTLLPGKAEVSLTPELVQKLKTFSNKSDFTLSMTMTAAWGMLLHKYSGSNDIVFGSTVLIRPSHIDVNSVGLFMNTVPVRLIIDDEKPASDIVKALCKQQIDRSEHEHLAVAAIQACSDLPKGVPLMDSIFVVQNYPIDESLTSQNGVHLEFVDSLQKTNFVLSVFALFSDTSVKLLLLYDNSFVHQTDADRMLTHYLELLNSFALNPVQPTKSLPILTQQEKNLLLVEWNKTYKVYPGIAGKCAHELISDQAKSTPTAVALVYPKESGDLFTQAAGKLSYQELEDMSNSLAQNLVQLGVKTDDLVGLSIEQSSWVMVVGMLAIWKAGGAYVALNPKLPADRLKYMIDKVNARVVLTMTHLVATIKPAIDSRVQVVPVDGQWERIQSAHRPVCPRTTVAPNNLAYVIFTSGSTGLPKGVMIEHRALCNKMVEYAQDHLTAADRVAQGSAYSFDASVPEIFSTLVAGASLYLLPVGVVVGPELAAFFRDNNITNSGILTPSRAATLKNEKFPSLRRVIAGGEQLTQNIVKMMASFTCRVFNAYLVV